MASENTIIIDVEVSASEAAQGLARVKNEIADLKQEQKDLNKLVKEQGTVTAEQAARMAEVSASLKELTAEEKMYTAQLNIATQGDREYGDSIVELSAQLAQLKAEYRGLSKEQRESAQGKEMLQSIQQLDQTLKEADYSLGDFGRNVGNYQSALAGLPAPVTKLITLFQGGFKNGLQAAGQAVKAFGKTLLTTPIGWMAAAAAALIGVFKQLQAAFQRNDEAGTKLSAAFARLQPVVTAIRKAFEGLANVVASVVGGVTKAASAVIGLLVPSFREASKAAEENVLRQDELEESRRKFATNEAEREKQIAELNKKARGDASLTAKEREDIYKQIDSIERQSLEDKKRIAKEEYEILVQRAKDTSDTSDKMKDAIVEARNAMLRAETEYLQGTTKIAQRQKQAAEEQEREEKARQEAAAQRWREAQQRRKEAADKELEEMRKLQDLETEIIEDEVERRRKTIDLSYKRQIEDLEKRLKEEKNLTVETYKAIRKQIELLRQKNAQEQEDLTVEIVKSENDKLLQETRRLEDINNSLIDDEFERRRDRTEKDYNRQIYDLQHRLDTETDMTIDQQNLITAQIKALQKKRDKDLEEIEKDALRKRYQFTQDEIANSLQERLNAVFGNAAEIAKLELRYAEGAYADLVTMDSKTKKALFGNEEAYRSAVLQAEADMLAAREKSSQALQQQAKEVADTMQQVTGALSDLFEAAAGDSEAYAKFKKAMAIVDATISLAQTIAAATAISTEGDPYTLAIRIASNVAAVTAQFAAVIKAIKAASIPSAPSFEHGGVVPGDSWTGDKVLIRANSGESVLTREMTANLLKMLADGVPMQRIDYGRLSAAVADAVREMPAPVLAYSEFKAFERDVRFSEQKMFND